MAGIERLLLGLGFLFGFAIGFASLLTDDMPIIAVFLFLASAVLGFAGPRGPWRWAAAAGAAVVLVTFGAWMTHLRVPYRPGSPAGAAASTVAFLFALAGAYAGAGVAAWFSGRKS
jgi:hypothetical protein